MIIAILILFVVLAIGTALLTTAIGQQRSAFNEQSSETAYSLAEAALNAQVFALSQQWPTSGDAPQPSSSPNLGYPTSCNAASNGTSYCPAASDLSSAYPANSQTCPTGTQKDVWSSSSSVSNGWTTYVRDAGAGGSASQSLFTSTGSAGEQNALPFDASGSGAVWVRAVGILNCHIAVVVAKVSEQVVGLNFPKSLLNANSFTISDSGNKDILNTQDPNGKSSQISLRCNGLGGQPPSSTCAGIKKSSQVAPVTSWASPPDASPTLSAAQLAAAKGLAISRGTYYPASTSCSSIGASQLQGSPVYIEGGSGCAISITSNPTINSAASPGFLVLVNGTLSFGGNLTYYGVIYAANQGGLSGTVVSLGGNATVDGGITADGSASLTLGSSGNGVINCTDTGNKCGDLEYNAFAFSGLVGFAGANSTPNTFRQLPDTQ
jgi:Tfp pilus assembly protein PilX